MARGLRLARGDADLLTDEMIEQSRLAHVGTADDGDEAAVELGYFGHDWILL